MPHCFVNNCGNYYGKTRGNSKVIYHMLPNNESLATKWMRACGKKELREVTPHARICSDHFSAKCYQRDLQHELLGLPLRRKLKIDAIPDRNLPKCGKPKNQQETMIAETMKSGYNQISVLKEVPKNKTETDKIKAITTSVIMELPKSKVKIVSKTNSCNKKEKVKMPIKSELNNECYNTKEVDSSMIEEKSNPQEKELNSPVLKSVTARTKKNDRKNIQKHTVSHSGNNTQTKSVKTNKKRSQNIVASRTKNSKVDITEKKKALSDTQNTFEEKNLIKEIKPVLGSTQILTPISTKQFSQNKYILFKDMSKNISIKTIPTQTNFLTPTLNKIVTSTPSKQYSNKIYEKFKIKTQELKKALDNDLQTNIQIELSKFSDKRKRLPMRSSIRIAKKKSIECLSDSFTEKVNSKVKNCSKPETFSDKLKFMAKLQLRFQRNIQSVSSLTCSMGNSLKQLMVEEGNKCLDKMQIVEDVRDGSEVNPPSSPGHADDQISSVLENSNVESKAQEAAPTENGHLVDDEQMHSQDEDKANDGLDVKKEQEKKEKELDKDIEKSNNDTTENSKRKLGDHEDTPIKRLRPDIEDEYTSRDKILTEEITECNGLDQIMTYSEQILAEIKALNELAREKEREWNHLIYLKKLKEELLIRLQRKRQILLLNETNLSEVPLDALTQSSLLTSNQKPNLLKMTNFEKSIPSSVLHKPSQMDLCSSLDFKQKHRPILDVQSIIADYRQRHPESVPRRGRRIRHGPGQKEADYQSELGMILNHMNGIRNKSISQAQDYCNFTENTPYRDMLIEFAKLSEREKDEVRTEIKKSHKPPPPYPEVTVHPVTTTKTAEPTSLLHGILTKASRKLQKNNTANPSQASKSSFSPCLAKLLTAPEKHNAASTTTGMDGSLGNNNMSLSEILSNTITKARNEITITPVAEYETSVKNIEEEFEEGPDRLIIDESSDVINLSGKTDSSEAEEVPQCQGCHQKAALFVCAGCGNQWYCSRDCQVEAWDEHSEVCSG